MNRPDLKSTFRYLRALVLYLSGLPWLLFRRPAKLGIVVLMFHRILGDSEFYNSSSQPELVVRESTFRALLDWLSKRAEIVDLGRGLPRWEKSSSRLRIAITFDDGWLDNQAHAAPLAAERNVPLTIFVCPGLMNQAFPFWPERVSYLLSRLKDKSLVADLLPSSIRYSQGNIVKDLIEELKKMSPENRSDTVRKLEEIAGVSELPNAVEPLNRTMNWTDIRQLRAYGVEIGSHTMTHPILTTLSSDRAASELCQSRQHIEAALDVPCAVLAYPNGNHNREIRTGAAGAGYKAAFTTEPGLWTSGTDPFRIPRINVFEQKLIGPNGRFSPAMATYYLFWRAFRASRPKSAIAAKPAVASVEIG